MFDFIGRSKLWFTLSLFLIVVSLATLAFNLITKGSLMNFGIDFTGGTVLQIRFEKEVSPGDVRKVLARYNLSGSVIQRAGERDFIIRTEPIQTDVRVKIVEDMQKEIGPAELLEVDTIGPVIGKELAAQGLWALLIASIGIIVYVSFRFEFKYAVSALLALYHDAIITIGIMALLWRNIDVTFVAALLTIMGYSINDTIVVFDRLRENIKKYGAKKKFNELMNLSINETLARSINTVLTTLIMVLCLLIFGGSTINNFALALLIGITVGAYSSIFVAPPLLAAWTKWESKR